MTFRLARIPILALLWLVAGSACVTKAAAGPSAGGLALESNRDRRWVNVGPPTLWELVLWADDIVLADADHREDVVRLFEAVDWEQTHLAVLETWKGAGRLRAVGQGKAVGCGYSPRLPEAGQRTVVFSRHRDGDDHLVGLRTPASATEVDQLRQVIQLAVAHQAAGRDLNRDWVMFAAQRRASRWDGLSLLDVAKPTGDELVALARAYIEEPSVDGAVGLAVDAFKALQLDGLDDAFAGSIDGLAKSSSLDLHLRAKFINQFAAARGCAAAMVDRDALMGGAPPEVRLAHAHRQLSAHWAEAVRQCGLHPRQVAVSSLH